MSYETVIGLEVHVELNTKSKIFCSCGTEFGCPPNTQICPVCTGSPGTLPTLNRSVVDYAIKTGLALNCTINQHSMFDKKNYFYPDLPKAYQVSQLYIPICQNGFIEIETDQGTKKIGIHEIHMEEDAGKLIHEPWEDCTLIDYNRGGIPLIEIVSRPDFSNGYEVISYLEKLREILIYLGVSDCKMQEGSMRADINLSVRPEGQKELGTRTEMKNMNSFKAIYRAIVSETDRQIEEIEQGNTIVQETRRWDDNKGVSLKMRSKEDATDYRYFPDPDFLPLVISNEWIEDIKLNIPETAETKRQRFVDDFKITEYDSNVITSDKHLCDLFENINSISKNPKESANIITGEIMYLLKEYNILPEQLDIDPNKIAELISLVEKGKINRTIAKEVLEEVFENDVEPSEYINKHNLTTIDDTDLIVETVKIVFENNEKSVNDYKAGKEKAFGFIIGQTMKELKGAANPKIVNEVVRRELELIKN